MTDQYAVRRPPSGHRLLQVIAVVVFVLVPLGCAQRLSVTIGEWGVFVVWAVAGILAVVWPMAYLVTGFRPSPRRSRAVMLTAGGLTLSSVGLLLIGWGLVMVLYPEYTVGWYLPARRGGGTELGDTEDALYTGPRLIAVGALIVAVVMAIIAAFVSEERAPEKGHEESASLGSELSTTARGLLTGCGVLFWGIALFIGLVSLIQYAGVRQRLSECTPGTGFCSTDIWVANELPWVLAGASAVALLGRFVGVRVWNSLWWVSWLPDGVRGTLDLVAAVLFHAGSVLAVSSGILYARWSSATCTGSETMRSCGTSDAGFSFTEDWASWVTIWALTTYAVLAYAVVLIGLDTVREAEVRVRARVAAPEPAGPSRRRVAVYLLSVAVVLGGGWAAISARHLASVPPASADSWEEYVAETMDPSQHPHLEGVRFEIPTGQDPEFPLIVQVNLAGDEPEMPAAEAADLIEAACAYVVSPWRSSTPETWVRLSYGPEEDSTRFVLVDCDSAHRQAMGELLAWMERHPAGSEVSEISIRIRDDGVLETELYLADTSTTTVRAGLDHLCSFPSTEGIPRSGSLLDDLAEREVEDIDCSDPEAVIAVLGG